MNASTSTGCRPRWQGWYRPPGRNWWEVVAGGDSYTLVLEGLNARHFDLRHAQILRWGTTPRDGCESCLGLPRRPNPQLAAKARRLLPHLQSPRGVRELASLLGVGPKGCRRLLACLDAAGLAECRGTGTRVCWVATPAGEAEGTALGENAGIVPKHSANLTAPS